MIRFGRIRVRVNQPAAQGTALRVAQRVVTDVTRQTLNRASVLTPVDTGTLRARNKMRVRAEGVRVRGTVYNDTRYALAVHEGTRPHIIRPRVKKALRFKGRGGVLVVRRWVRHPGTRGRPWLARAGREVAARNGFRWTER